MICASAVSLPTRVARIVNAAPLEEKRPLDEIAEMPLPPPAITPMNANWDPPLNSRRLRAMVWRRSSPAVTDRAPKDSPYSPVAIATERAMRTAGDWRSATCQG